MQTIDIKTKTWFDKVNGNTYFAQRITIDFGIESEKEIVNDFQYGYSGFEYKAMEKVQKEYPNADMSNVIVRHNLYENCLKRELKNI